LAELDFMQAEAAAAMSISAGKNNGRLESAERNWVRSAKFGLNYDTAAYFFLIALHADVEPVSCDTATYPLPVAATQRRTLYRSLRHGDVLFTGATR
jgi:hypothetical protein